MTDDEIIKMAYKSGLCGCMYVEDEVNHLREFANLVAEACAKVCDDMNSGDEGDADVATGAFYCAAAIRARKG